jgi:uncharacterized protein YaeQ
VALTATVFNIDIDLADNDRGVYETLALRVAQHPSETDEYLLTRVLAYALEYTEGLEFAPGGLSDPEAPTIAARDLTGVMRLWIEIGAPEAARLHKAAKASPRVVVYTHRDVNQWLARLAGERIHRAEAIEVWAVDRALLAALAAHLDRRMAFSLSVTDRELFVAIGTETFTAPLTRYPLP